MRFNVFIQIFFACVIGVLVGCGQVRLTSQQEVSGEYVFVYKTGEGEVLGLGGDRKYRQELYRYTSSYRLHLAPTYTNEGIWTYTDRRVPEIIMANWLSFCDFPDPRRRVDPARRFSWL